MNPEFDSRWEESTFVAKIFSLLTNVEKRETCTLFGQGMLQMRGKHRAFILEKRARDKSSPSHADDLRYLQTYSARSLSEGVSITRNVKNLSYRI